MTINNTTNNVDGARTERIYVFTVSIIRCCVFLIHTTHAIILSRDSLLLFLPRPYYYENQGHELIQNVYTNIHTYVCIDALSVVLHSSRTHSYRQASRFNSIVIHSFFLR